MGASGGDARHTDHAEAHRVSEQIPNGDRPRCIMHRVERTSRIVERLAIGEFRQPVVNGLVEPQCAFLDEHHHRDGRHRLRHGRQAEDRVTPHRRSGVHVLEPSRA